MKNQTEMETRTSKIQIRSLSDGQESRIVEGYAVRFNEPSADMGFIETILPGAITEETIRKSDIFARLDHREDTVLARSRFGNGSLILELRNDGLFYTFEAPHTQIGDELLEHIKRGEMDSSSFAFSLPADGKGDKWTQKEGKFYRTISKIDRLYDVSCVWTPAYPTTSCSTRAQEVLDAAKELNDKLDSMMREVEELKIDIQENGKEDGTPGDTD